MITKAAGIPNLAFYTNFQPIFDGMKRFTNSYSNLLQTTAAFMNNTRRQNAHINPKTLEGMVRSSTLGKHVDVVG